MDTGRLINMLVRTLLKRGLRQALRQKIDPNDNSSPEARERQQQARATQKRVNQAMRASRRFTKF